jgi:hypothetical protein
VFWVPTVPVFQIAEFLIFTENYHLIPLIRYKLVPRCVTSGIRALRLYLVVQFAEFQHDSFYKKNSTSSDDPIPPSYNFEQVVGLEYVMQDISTRLTLQISHMDEVESQLGTRF